MFKRVFLFITVNILVIITISIMLNVLGIRPYLTANGIDYNSLLAFAAVIGFSGALISLATSRMLAKMMLGVRVIDPTRPSSATERDLVQRIHRLAQKAGLPAMPQVGIYNSPELNAFATGPTKSRALVAVSSGLLAQMDDSAVEGVLGHEISHIANGDMVTMTLLQGVVNTFVIFFARIAAWAVAQAFSGNRDDNRGVSPVIHFIAIIVFEILFSLLGAVVVSYFSRRREFRADNGGAKLAGRERMVHALKSLKAHFEQPIDGSHPSVASLKINGAPSRFLRLLATHPPLDARIQALEKMSGV